MPDRRSGWLITCSCGWTREFSQRWAAESAAKLHPKLGARHRHQGAAGLRRLPTAGVAALLARRGTARTVTTDAIGDQVQQVPKGQLPEFAGTGEIGRLYRYAVEHGNELQFIPCFCGCFRFGHKSNRDCYIEAFHQDGTLTFTSHAAT